MSFPQWKGLFDWSMKYQDGTRPSDWDSSQMDPSKMQWLEGVLKHYMQDFAGRMRQIKEALDTGVAPAGPSTSDRSDGGAVAAPPGQCMFEQAMSLEDKELLLDELMDIVSSIDFARDLHKIGGLPTLLELLSTSQPSLQWRAAEVVATCVANNPPVQQWFLEGGALPSLMALLNQEGSDEPHVMLRVKALLALSGLIRHCQPGLAAFLQAGGAHRVAALCGDSDARVQRKALSLLQYMFSQQPGLISQESVTGTAVASALALLQRSGHTLEGSDVRTNAVRLLSQAGQEPAGWELLHSCEEVPGCLRKLEGEYARLSTEDRDSCEDERAAVQDLQQLLSGPAPQCSQGSRSDHVSVHSDANLSQPLTVPVNQPAITTNAEPNSSNALGLMVLPSSNDQQH